VAFVTPASVDVEAVLEAAVKVLPHYMVPSVIVPMDVYPLTGNGKVDKKALAKMDLKLKSSCLETKAESDLAAVLTGFFKLDGSVPMSKETSLFDLGFDSLQASPFLRALKKAFTATSRGLKSRDLWSHHRLSALARRLAGQESEPKKNAPKKDRVIVALHGNPGNGEQMKKSLTLLAEEMNARVVVLDSLFATTFTREEFADAQDEIGQRLWEHWDPSWRQWWNSKDKSRAHEDIEANLDHLVTELTKLDRIDFLVGFSAGATMVHLLDSLASRGYLVRTWSKSVFFSGCPLEKHSGLAFPSQLGSHPASFLSECLDVPSVHVRGEKESETQSIVEGMRGRYNVEKQTEMIHPGGHEIPLQSEMIKSLAQSLLS